MEDGKVIVFMPMGQRYEPGCHAWGWKGRFHNSTVYVVACLTTGESVTWIDREGLSLSPHLLWSRDLGIVQDHEVSSVLQDGALAYFISNERSDLLAERQRTVVIYYCNNRDPHHTYRLRDNWRPLPFSESCQPDGFWIDLEFALTAINTVPSLMISISQLCQTNVSLPQLAARSRATRMRSILVNCITLLTWLMHGLMRIPKAVLSGCCVVSLFQVSTLGRLALTRKEQYNYCMKHVNDKSNMEQQRQSNNMAWSFGANMLLGIIVSLWLLSGDHLSLVSNLIDNSGQNLVGVVERQLVWLMGVPAGLKLNTGLDQFLGEFFLYLISIWSAYLQFVVSPLLPTVMFIITTSSCLGASVLLALLADMLSLMTFHIYCFYVFAAKIYSVQVYALGSLWRLFTGKKWNVLRNRVDSCEYNVDQLLLGTLLFTVLFFLLPTVAMYYLVFTLLRITVLALHLMISLSINFLTRLPVYGLLIRLVDPLQLPGGIKIDLKTPLRSSPTSVQLILQSQPCSWSSLWRWDGSKPSAKLPDFKHTVMLLLQGHVVYPWSWTTK